jgi:hypothetical protein
MYGLNDDAQGFPRYAYCCSPLQFSVAYVNKPKALVAGRGYHIVITSNIPVSRWLEGIIGNYAEGGIETVRGRYGGSFRGLSIVRFWPITQFIIS